MIRPILALGLAVFIWSGAHAQSELDFDGDGIADVLYTSASGQVLRWRTVPSNGSSPIFDQEFGLVSDLPIPGPWLTPDSPSLAIVRLDSKKNTLVWKALRPDGILIERTFGKGGDYVLAGGDFDGNGVADAALMRIRPKGYRWTIAFDIFVEPKLVTRTFKFGKSGDRVFYLSPEGDHDWLGVLGLNSRRKKALMTLRDPASRATKKIVLPKRLATGDRPRPFPVRLSTGSQGFVITTQDESDTKVTTYDLEGTEISQLPIPGISSPVAADFDSAFDGDEILLSTSTRLTVLHPETEAKVERTPVSGTVVETFKVQQISGPTPTATVGPVATATTSPTASPTARPN